MQATLTLIILATVAAAVLHAFGKDNESYYDI